MVTLPEEYLALKAERQRGFQTLYTYSMLTHVDMETGFSLSVCLKDAANGQYLKHALIGRKEEGAEIVTPEAHDFKCRYTSVKVEFQNVKFRVESCRGKGVPLLLLVTPLSQEKMPPLLVLEGGYLWNRPALWRGRKTRCWARQAKNATRSIPPRRMIPPTPTCPRRRRIWPLPWRQTSPSPSMSA